MPLGSDTTFATTVYRPGTRLSSVSDAFIVREKPLPLGPVMVSTLADPAGTPAIVSTRDPTRGPDGESLHAAAKRLAATNSQRAFSNFIDNGVSGMACDSDGSISPATGHRGSTPGTAEGHAKPRRI